MPDDFGVFAPVFESAHGYLALLHLNDTDCVDAVRRVRVCAAADVGSADLLGLLEEVNWRPTLVAAVAALFGPYDVRIVQGLWRRFDAGCWVTPQLAVVLSRVDPEFVPEARRRLEAGCRLEAPGLEAMSMAERHSAEGPAGAAERCAKAAAALQAVLCGLVPVPAWLAAVLGAPGHQALVASDMDGGGRIALEWSAGLRCVLERPWV